MSTSGTRTPIAVADIVEAFEMATDETSAFANRVTGEVRTVSHEILSAAGEEEADDEDEQDMPEWQAEALAEARDVVGSDDWLALPDRYDIHEWAIMKEFADAVAAADQREQLLGALRGRGAFRYFKDVVHRLGIAERWYGWRTRALEDIARAWLEEHGLEGR